ncbi:unnamed protein product [Phytomonas sp. Hart1]|nr:unnamed protein product [Phytomonas sp. Hart1]|eukprot:CCW70215.1 unnamed protein product [Phytomonas sp. isolate Hart1]
MLSAHIIPIEQTIEATFDPTIEQASASMDHSSPNSLLSLPFSSVPQPMVGSLIIIMVGLPGRGKSYVGQQICCYFQWNGLKCKIFSHQSYQRNHLQKYRPAEEAASGGVSEPLMQADIANKIIIEIATDIVAFISNTDRVAILDGTNSTNSRRQAILRALNEHLSIKSNRIVFVEIVSNDKKTISRNILRAREMHVDPPENFEQRYYENIARHESIYETLNPIRDTELSYIQIQENNIYSLNMISGWMPSRLAYMLHNFNQSQQNVYLTRAGEHVNLISGRIGGNSELTDRGVAYSIALFNFFKEEVGASNPFQVMSSSSIRCMQTVRYFAEESAKQMSNSCTSKPGEAAAVKLNCNVNYIPTLEDISYGDCDGQLLTDISKTMLSTLQSIKADSYNTPWPNGECIQHVFNTRLEPHIHDIQASSTPVLVVSHLTLLQGLHAFFVTKDTQVVAPQNAYRIKIPLETVVRIRIVGIHRVAELVNLSKEVDQIELEMMGKVSRATRSHINKFLSLLQNSSNPDLKGITKPLN